VDGAVWVAWLVGIVLVTTWLAGQRARARALAAAAAVSAAVFGLVTLWRVLTFGDWLPNTARAKLGFGARATERGLDYVVHFGLSFPGALVLLALALFAFARDRRRDAERRDPLTRLVLVGVAATVLHAVLAGGDFMAFGRFLLPALPLLVIGGGIGLMELGGRGLGPGRAEVAPKGMQGVAVAQGQRVTLGLVAGLGMLLPALDVPLTPTAWRAAFRFRHNPGPTGVPQPFVSEPEQWRNMCLRAEEWGVVGRDLARWSPPDASFVAGAVGALGWFSERRVFDRHGLLARDVALLPPTPELRSPGHDKFVGADFFAPWRPTYDDVGLWSAQDLARHPYADRAVVLGPSERAGFVLWVIPRNTLLRGTSPLEPHPRRSAVIVRGAPGATRVQLTATGERSVGAGTGPTRGSRGSPSSPAPGSCPSAHRGPGPDTGDRSGRSGSRSTGGPRPCGRRRAPRRARRGSPSGPRVAGSGGRPADDDDARRSRPRPGRHRCRG
jgi:hypothetical protein